MLAPQAPDYLLLYEIWTFLVEIKYNAAVSDSSAQRYDRLLQDQREGCAHKQNKR